MDTIGILASMALQYGVPLEVLVSKFSHVRFEPSGFTKNPEIPIAKSLIDYIFRFLGTRFLSPEQKAEMGLAIAGPRRTAVPQPPAAGARGGCARPRGQRARLQPASRRAQLSRLRRDHGAQRQLLQVPQLRRDQRLLVSSPDSGRRDSGERRSGGAAVWSFPDGGGVVAGGTRRGAPSGAPRRWSRDPSSRPVYGLTLRRSSAERRSA